MTRVDDSPMKLRALFLVVQASWLLSSCAQPGRSPEDAAPLPLSAAPELPLTIAGDWSYPLPATGQRGAAVPWTSYEAEDGDYAGTLEGPGRNVGSPAGEASGRKAVRLAGNGHYVSWVLTRPANALVLRLSIPDAAGGGGLSSSLTIYKNGTAIQSLAVSSRYAWLYGNEADPSNAPASGAPRRIYDESSTLLNQAFAAGDTLKLQVDEARGDTAAWYDIDFAETEVAILVPKPANCVDAADYGVDPRGLVDSTNGLNAAVGAARSQGRTLWIGPGRYRQSSILAVQGLTIQGSGMWTTFLLGTENAAGFNVMDGNTGISDLSIRGDCTNRSGSNGLGGPFGTNGIFERLWIEHTVVGAWVGWDASSNRPSSLTFRSCRIRDTFADGINLCNGTRDSRIANTTTRYTGDDGLAIWSESLHTERSSRNNVIEYCTAQIPWRAAGLAIYGGEGNVVQYSRVLDTLTYPGLTVSSSFWPYPFAGSTSFHDLDLVRCGGAFWGGQHFAAIWLFAEDSDFAAPMSFAGIDIVEPTYSGIMLQADRPKNPDWSVVAGSSASSFVPSNVSFSTISIAQPGDYGVWLKSGSSGGAYFEGINVTSGKAAPALKNDAGAGFALSGNLGR
jgi:hypothetical protein